MKKFIALLLAILMLATLCACKGKEKNTNDDEKESMTEEETEEPNPLAKIVRIRLESDTGICLFYLGDHTGTQTVSLKGVRKVLFNINNRNVYSEVSDRYEMSIDEGNELTHVIVVFKKDYKLTENDKNVLNEFDMDYMFER